MRAARDARRRAARPRSTGSGRAALPARFALSARSALLAGLAAFGGLRAPEPLSAQPTGRGVEDAGLPARSARLEVRASVAPDSATIGDPITIRYEVTADSSVRVLFPKLSPALGDFEVKSARVVTRGDGGLTTSALEVQAVAYDTGPRSAPPLEIPYRSPSGDGALRADSVSVFIASVIPPDENPTDVKPVKPPVEIDGRVDPLRVLLLALGLLGILGLAYAWRHRKRAPAPVRPVPAPPPVPADVAALEELARIERLGLAREGRVKEHYSLVADCLRVYLRDRFGIDAPDRTTAEVLPLFERLRRGESEPDLLRRILEESDLVKFAKFLPPPGAPARVIGEARRFVVETRPRPEAAAATASVAHSGEGPPPGVGSMPETPPARTQPAAAASPGSA